MKHYLLFYEIVDDYVARRAPLRAAHLEHAQRASERGELVLAGTLADPVDGAVLLFRGSSPGVAESFARADPYVVGGLVTEWRVRAWTTAVGEHASVPAPSRPVPTHRIARIWRGATAEGKDAEAYFEHVTRNVLPSLTHVPGHRGANVLRRSTGTGTEFVVMTLWNSMDAIRGFAGDNLERAVVEPNARAVLTDFEEVVRHYEVRHTTVPPASDP